MAFRMNVDVWLLGSLAGIATGIYLGLVARRTVTAPTIKRSCGAAN